MFSKETMYSENKMMFRRHDKDLILIDGNEITIRINDEFFGKFIISEVETELGYSTVHYKFNLGRPLMDNLLMSQAYLSMINILSNYYTSDIVELVDTQDFEIVLNCKVEYTELPSTDIFVDRNGYIDYGLYATDFQYYDDDFTYGSAILIANPDGYKVFFLYGYEEYLKVLVGNSEAHVIGLY